MSQPPEIIEPVWEAGEEEAPLHGFQGDRGAVARRPAAPRGLTIALSREAGARGGTIARLAGKRLGWQVDDQELLEVMAQDGVARQGLLDGLTPACLGWVEGRLAELRRRHGFAEGDSILGLARLVL